MTTRKAVSFRGLTLIEVLLALALLMALMAAFFQFLSNTLLIQESAQRVATRQLHARTLCDHLERDLLTSLAGDAKSGAGVMGSSTELRVLSRGMSAFLARDGYANRLANDDLVESRYRFDEAARELIVSRRPHPLVSPAGQMTSRGADGTASFNADFDHMMSAADTAVAHDAAADEDELAAHKATLQGAERLGPIVRVRFRYFDGNTWQEEFDSLETDQLPHAVEIAIWLRELPKAPGEPAMSDEQELWEETSARLDERLDGNNFDESDGADDFTDAEDASDINKTEFPSPDVVRVVIIPDAKAGGSP